MSEQPYGSENLKKLRNIVKLHQHSQLSFEHNGRARVDAFTANAMITVYDALSADGKAKFVRMLSTKAGFAKLLDFTWKHIK
jgi:hypothetical protein